MIRKAAILLLVLAIGYIGWIAVLNLPGRTGDGATASADRRPSPVRPPSPAAAPARVAAPPGVLVIPVAGIRAEQLSDTFDDARGAGRVHDAIDIMAPRGTPVIAAAAGTVEKLFDSRLGGLTVYIRRPGGQWIDYYAHLDGYAPGLAEGRKVAQGEMIGTVGSSGDASSEAPHLHYAINAMAPGEGWWQGTVINPYPLLRKGR